MGIANIINNSTTTSGGEIVRELVNSSDGQGLHFDGAAANVAFTPVDLGTKCSFEFVVKASSWTDSSFKYLVDFGSGGRFTIGTADTAGAQLAIYNGSNFYSFGASPLDDLKVHHLVVTVDGTAATLYDNGNQVGTATITSPTIDSCSLARLASKHDSNLGRFYGTYYRARFYNKTLSADDVRTAYERADVPFADQYGRQAVNDGGFTSASNWLTNGGWSVASNKATFTASGGTGRVGQNSVFTADDAGKQVHITFTVGASTGTIWIGNSSGTTQYVDGGYNSYTVGTHTVTFTLPSSETTLGFYSQYASSGSWEISNVGVYVEGCVSDYDLAFANPTQSRTVQDRSGAADGTASSSTAVTQVQPVVQGNLTSLAVHTAAVTPADGEVWADRITAANSGDTQSAELRNGELTLARGSSTPTYINFPNAGASLQLRGPSYATALTIDSTGDITQTATTPALIVKDTQDKSWAKNDALGSLQFHTADTSGVGAHEIAGIHTETDEAGTNTQVAGAMVFKTAAYNNATPVERMRIGSNGLASFSNGITVEGANNWSHISARDTQSVSIADDAQVQLADNEAGAMMIHVYDRGTGYGGLIFASYAGAPVIVADPSGVFAVSDTDNKYCVIKSNSSHDVYFKNRSGVTRQFCILVTAGVLDNF